MIKDEPTDLKNVIILRVFDSFTVALWTAVALPLTEELFNMELTDLLPLMLLALVTTVSANALMPCWLKCFTYSKLFKYGMYWGLMNKFLKCFLFKNVGRFGNLAFPFFLFSNLCTYPFNDINSVMIVGVLTMFTNENTKGTTLGAVESAVQLTQILANSGGLALTGVLLSDSVTQHIYWPTATLLLSFFVGLYTTYIGVYFVVPQLEEFKRKEEETAISLTQEAEDVQMSGLNKEVKRTPDSGMSE